MEMACVPGAAAAAAPTEAARLGAGAADGLGRRCWSRWYHSHRRGRVLIASSGASAANARSSPLVAAGAVQQQRCADTRTSAYTCLNTPSKHLRSAVGRPRVAV